MSDPVAVSLVRGSSCARAPGRAPAGGEPWNRLRCVPSRCPGGNRPTAPHPPGPAPACRATARATADDPAVRPVRRGCPGARGRRARHTRRHDRRPEQARGAAPPDGTGRADRAARGAGGRAGPHHVAPGRTESGRRAVGRDRDARSGGRRRGEGGSPARRRPCPGPGYTAGLVRGDVLLAFGGTRIDRRPTSPGWSATPAPARRSPSRLFTAAVAISSWSRSRGRHLTRCPSRDHPEVAGQPTGVGQHMKGEADRRAPGPRSPRPPRAAGGSRSPPGRRAAGGRRRSWPPVCGRAR